MFALVLGLQMAVAGRGPVWLSHAVIMTALIAFSLGAIALRGRGFAAHGFRRGTRTSWWKVIGAGLLLGMTAVAAIIFSPAEGLQARFAGYRFTDIVIWIWFYSSLSEEIFTRGWFQSAVADDPSPGAARRAEIASALLFGSMHLSLLLGQIDGWTILILLAATTALGFLAARLRTVSGSILPPILIHISFNIGGAIAAIVITVASIASGGAVPRP